MDIEEEKKSMDFETFVQPSPSIRYNNQISSNILFRRSLHIRLGASLSPHSKDVLQLRGYLENELSFDLCETLTDQTYGELDLEATLEEILEETQMKTKRGGTGYVINVIQVQAQGFQYRGDLFMMVP